MLNRIRSQHLSRRRMLATLFGAAAGSLLPRTLWPAAGDDAGLNASLSASTSSRIRFEEIAAKSGLQFTTRNCATPNKNQIETMVAGVALLDYGC
jgi:hypothetical protein